MSAAGTVGETVPAAGAGVRPTDAALLRFLCIVPALLLTLLMLADPELDHALFLAVNGKTAALPDDLWALISTLGGGSYMCALALPWVQRRPRHVATLLLLTIVAGVGINLLKDVVDTDRPITVLGAGAFHSIGPGYAHFGFPSGHAASAFAVALLLTDLLEYRLLESLVVLGCATVIAFSRVAVGTHWPLDVAGGAALGAATAWACLAVTSRARLFSHRAWHVVGLVMLAIVAVTLVRGRNEFRGYAGVSTLRWLGVGLLAYAAVRYYRGGAARAPWSLGSPIAPLLRADSPALRFLRFGLVGLSGFFVDLTVYSILLANAGLSPELARIGAYVAAATSNWFCNRTFTFSDRLQAPHLVQWNKYLLMCAVSFVPSFGTFWVLIHTLPLFAAHTRLALAAGVVSGMVFNFGVASRWIFPRRSAADAASMGVDAMRAIDRWLGVPLCAAASVLSKAGAWARPRPPAGVRRALFIELSEMGSAILADPAMRRLRAHTDAELYFAIFAHNAASLELLQTVPRANVCTLRSRNLAVLAVDVVRFAVWCRRRGIDTVIDLELFSRFTTLLSWLSGARRRVGFHGWHDEGLYRGSLLTHCVRYNPHRHIATNFIALVATVVDDRRADPYCRVAIEPPDVASAPRDEAAIAAVRAVLRSLYGAFDPSAHRLVLVNPNASDLLPQRCWMPERFAAVSRALLRDYDDVLVVLTGAASDEASCRRVAALVEDPRCVISAGRFRLHELPSLYQSAELMLTNDSGPAHFASVTPLPTFVLFGPETPGLYGPLGNSVPIYAGLACSPCVSAANHRKTSCANNVCMQAITPERVVDLLRQQLGRGTRESAPAPALAAPDAHWKRAG